MRKESKMYNLDLKTVEVPYFGITEWEKWGEDSYYTLQNVGLDFDTDWVEEFGLYIESFIAQITVTEDGLLQGIYPKFWTSFAPTGPAIFSMMSHAPFDQTVGHLMFTYKQLIIDEGGAGRKMVDEWMAGFGARWNELKDQEEKKEE